MDEFNKDFGPFDDAVWFNSASEGPLPHVSVKALEEAVKWKIKPQLLSVEKFVSVPKRLRECLGKLINVPAKDIILGNSATYGIHLLANGIQWNEGDEILVMQNDFPTDVLPWLNLEKSGVRVRQIKPRSAVLQADELEQNISPKTRLVCISHIHTFTGHVVDIEKMGKICRQNKVIFVVNFTQTLGNMPVDISMLPVDAITSSGFKWLCGPYGTGFCWIRPELREQLSYNHAFWSAVLTEEDLSGRTQLSIRGSQSARQYDVFGTANFFNFYPWTASVQYLLDIGIDKIWQHNQCRVSEILEGLDKKKYKLISPANKKKRSCLIVISHHKEDKNKAVFENLKNNGLFGAFWQGNVRISPHLFNTKNDVVRLLTVLNEQK